MMKEQRELVVLIKKLQAGKVTQEETSRLQQLIDKYPEYKEIVDAHYALLGTRSPFPEVPEEEFKIMRNTILRKIQLKQTKSYRRGFSEILENIKLFVLKPEMAVAALTLIIGFLLGKAMPPDQASSSLNIVQQITELASENKELVDVQNSPMRYSNVSFQEVDAQSIAISFDVSRHLDMIIAKQDPLVKEIIAQSLLNPSNSGEELKAIEYTESIIDKKIKEALIFSMQKAPMLAVRMKAMSNLMNYKDDWQVQNAFLQVLKEEESVQMRLLAIDYFEATSFNPDTVWAAIKKSDIKINTPVMLRAQKYIKENN